MENSKNIFNENPKSSLAKVLDIISTMASKPSGFIGLAILIFHVTLAITSPWFAPYDYKAINPTLMLNAPSSEFWFGTDSLGRDVFTRTILGGRTALNHNILWINYCFTMGRSFRNFLWLSRRKN